MAKAADIFIANRTACISFNGSPAFIRRGYTTVRKGHPLYEQHKDAFSPLEVQFDVEAPKAAPKPAVKPEPARVVPTPKDTTETRSTGDVDF
jgi:hypothetical protein